MKVGHLDPLNPEQMIYPFASKMEDLNVVFVPDYDPKSPGYETCCDGLYLDTTTLSERDVVEEALAAKVMPLSRGWAPLRMEKKTFPGCTKELPYPRFDLVRPADRSDEALVAELEREAHYYLGSYSPKEVEAAKARLCHEGRINRSFHGMGISVKART